MDFGFAGDQGGGESGRVSSCGRTQSRLCAVLRSKDVISRTEPQKGVWKAEELMHLGGE